MEAYRKTSQEVGDQEEEDEEGLRLQIDEEINKYMPKPPDGGWGWVVVFGSFMIHVIADGFTYTFGIFYVHILNHYGVSKASASWIASILVGVTLGSGPISGILVNKFGCRVVTIAGAILSSICLFASIYADSIVVLYFTIGLGTGLGFGLIYLPAIVCVTGYFEKRRSFATGIAVCGSGIGTFMFSPMVEALIALYSWKGALIILSGLMLNCVFFGALFRPLKMPELPPVVAGPSYEAQDSIRKEPLNGTLEETLESSQSPLKSPVTTKEPRPVPRIEISVAHANGGRNLLKGKDGVPRNCSQGCLENNHIRPTEQFSKMYTSLQLIPKDASTPVQGHQFDFSKQRNSISFISRKDSFYGGSIQNIPGYKTDPESWRTSMLRFREMEETDSEQERAKVCGCVPCSKSTRDTMASLMDWSLLGDRVFLLFALSNFCTSIGFNAPYIFIVDRALESGIAFDQASYLLSVVGISNTVSRVLLGWISDKPWINRLYLYNIALTLCGVGTCISIFFSAYWAQAFYAAVFGSMSGAYVGLTSVVLVDLLGMERLTNAFGLLLMFQGIASLIGPPLCGALYDMSKSYDYSFLLAGVMIAISGLMLFFIPCVIRMQEKIDKAKYQACAKR